MLQKIKKIVTWKSVLILLVIVWLGFSLFYIVRDQWQKFQAKQIQTAYQNGVTDAVRLLMKETEKCAAVPLQDGDKTVKVIRADCPR